MNPPCRPALVEDFLSGDFDFVIGLFVSKDFGLYEVPLRTYIVESLRSWLICGWFLLDRKDGRRRNVSMVRTFIVIPKRGSLCSVIPVASRIRKAESNFNSNLEEFFVFKLPATLRSVLVIVTERRRKSLVFSYIELGNLRT